MRPKERRVLPETQVDSEDELLILERRSDRTLFLRIKSAKSLQLAAEKYMEVG
ncbi:hypothetical protein KIN20_009097 [Parelaphostrongylus tenuis]|uniref:Uncharacterized protein n=1 Tax=Parelaphostrongylus tenuis TaxID=148309 RepID=A0AAD5M5T4_PARTN|nr:hypothetical protein KIN20_009097 [Parelaphostrongylus tenuis]